MANGYINIAHLYKRMPVLTDTNGDYLIAVSDLRTAIAMAAAETGEVHSFPCKIGDTVYVVSQGAGFSCAWNVYQSRITAIYLDRHNKLFVGTETERENVGGYVEVERVFLTKEEAEEELVRIINKLGGGEEQ